MLFRSDRWKLPIKHHVELVKLSLSAFGVKLKLYNSDNFLPEITRDFGSTCVVGRVIHQSKSSGTFVEDIWHELGHVIVSKSVLDKQTNWYPYPQNIGEQFNISRPDYRASYSKEFNTRESKLEACACDATAAATRFWLLPNQDQFDIMNQVIGVDVTGAAYVRIVRQKLLPIAVNVKDSILNRLNGWSVSEWQNRTKSFSNDYHTHKNEVATALAIPGYVDF